MPASTFAEATADHAPSARSPARGILPVGLPPRANLAHRPTGHALPNDKSRMPTTSNHHSGDERQLCRATWLMLLWLTCAPTAHAFLNPTVGRWASRDPIGEVGGENIYASVYNAPVDSVDPVGLATCSSNYKWIVHSPLLDRDLLSFQVITINTTLRVGTNSTSVPRSMLLSASSSRYGLTITEPSLVAGDCCCAVAGAFKPTFELAVHSQIYVLDRRSRAWGASRISSGDPNVDRYWHYSPQLYRRQLVLSHERRHQAHGRTNFEAWKSALQAAESSSYASQTACLQAVSQALRQTWREFNMNEQAAVDALHSGGTSP
jgi:hypothetical protein